MIVVAVTPVRDLLSNRVHSIVTDSPEARTGDCWDIVSAKLFALFKDQFIPYSSFTWAVDILLLNRFVLNNLKASLSNDFLEDAASHALCMETLHKSSFSNISTESNLSVCVV